MTQIITVTTEPVTDPQVPTVTYSQERADEFMKALDKISVVVPQVTPEEYSSAKVTRGQLRVPDQFCLTAIAVVEQIPATRIPAFDPVAARERMQKLEAFRPAVDKVHGFAKNAEVALDQMKAEVAVPAMQLYQHVKRLLKDNPTPELKAAVDNLRRDFALRRMTKAQKEEKKALAALKAAAADQHKKEVQKTA